MQACATTRYNPLAELQGAGIEQLNDRSFRVEYRVSPFTSQDVLDDFLRRRCAEVTLREGYEYFAMTEKLIVDVSAIHVCDAPPVQSAGGLEPDVVCLMRGA